MMAQRTKAKANVKTLIEERDKLLREMDALKNKIAGLELAITLIQRGGDQPSTGEAPRRGGTKNTLLDLLREAGTTGLNATSAVELAARRNIKLERGTTASTLSRMKSEELVVYDGERYRLPEFSRGTVVPLAKSS
jgi:hypothetical protein